MPDIEAPTGDEQPQKYYGSSYLNDVDAAKREIASAAAEGREVDLDGLNELAIAAAAPHLLSADQQKAVANATSPGSNVEGNLNSTKGSTFVEQQGDEEWRVDSAQEAPPLSPDPQAPFNENEAGGDFDSDAATNVRTNSQNDVLPSTPEGVVSEVKDDAQGRDGDEMIGPDNTHHVEGDDVDVPSEDVLPDEQVDTAEGKNEGLASTGIFDNDDTTDND